MRKKSGTNSIAKTIKAMPADMPLIKNLGNPEYVKIILSDRNSLEERFADIDIQKVRKQLRDLQSTSVRVPKKLRQLIRSPDLPQRLAGISID